MLKYLRIQNIILVEEANIPFNPGFNILTGETGAGKSAIMSGLGLAVGERSDTQLIRKGCAKGVVEAVFDIDHHPFLPKFLNEAGIEHDSGQELIIRRELPATGKSRVFINHQIVQLTLLRKIGLHLVHLVGQHTNQKLLLIDYHRELVDIYGELASFIQTYQNYYQQEKTLRQTLNALIQEESQRLRDIDICQRELEELDQAHLKEGEDEELFAEYSLLANAEEVVTKINEINQALTGEKQPILPTLHRQKSLLDSLIRFDANLTETSQALQAALLELREIAHTLQNYAGTIQPDPEKLHLINERLLLINRLKRKYGTTLIDICQYHVQTREKLQRLENADIQIEELKLELEKAESLTHQAAKTLTQQRQEAAKALEMAVTHELHTLNMLKAEFLVVLTSQKRTINGDDKIEFFLRPNIGEHEIALKDGASGGELSRVLLALQTLLAGKDKIPTLLFDEVDANIGGETAAIVGEKLKNIGQQHQVICVTHFPQVASQAHHHLHISKQEKEGRTFTSIQSLDELAQQMELQRMLGRKIVRP